MATKQTKVEKMCADELELVQNQIVAALWKKLPKEKITYQGKKILFVALGTTPRHYIFESENYARDHQLRWKISQKRKDSWASCWNFKDCKSQGVMRLMIGKVKSALKKEYNELYVKQKITEKVKGMDEKRRKEELQAKTRQKKAKDKRIAARAHMITVNGTRNVAREAVLFTLETALEGVQCPVRIDTSDWLCDDEKVYVRIKNPLKDYAARAFEGKVHAPRNPNAKKPYYYYGVWPPAPRAGSMEIDRSGKDLYDALVASGLDTDKILKHLVASDDADCRQFAVMYGKQAVAGLLDANQVVRKLAEDQVKEKQEKKAKTEAKKLAKEEA